MAAKPRIRRLTLVPHGTTDETVRRYRLALLDELALATPPDPQVRQPVQSQTQDPERRSMEPDSGYT